MELLTLNEIDAVAGGLATTPPKAPPPPPEPTPSPTVTITAPSTSTSGGTTTASCPEGYTMVITSDGQSAAMTCYEIEPK